MAYGNYAPFYRPNYFNPMPQMAENQGQFQFQTPMQTNTPMQQTQITNDMIWVLNENEATSYPVAPNNSVVLWDKSNPTIYVKSVNAQGVPSMRTLDFTERTQNIQENAPKTHECNCGDKFATKEEIDKIKANIEELEEKYKTLTDKSKTKTKKESE